MHTYSYSSSSIQTIQFDFIMFNCQQVIKEMMHDLTQNPADFIVVGPFTDDSKRVTGWFPLWLLNITSKYYLFNSDFLPWYIVSHSYIAN